MTCSEAMFIWDRSAVVGPAVDVLMIFAAIDPGSVNAAIAVFHDQRPCS